MSARSPRYVVLDTHRRSSGGWGSVIGLLIVIGLMITFWYISLPVIVFGVAALVLKAKRRRERARRRPGPKDPWLNEVAVALLDLGFEERARNTGTRLGGAGLDGDIGLRTSTTEAWVNCFIDSRAAHEAEMGLRAEPRFRQTLTSGRAALRTEGRVLVIAKGRHGAADEFLLDEVVRCVARIPLGPGPGSGAGGATRHPQPERSLLPAGDSVEQLRRLGELRDAGVINGAEFAAKKVDLLRRI